MLLSMKQMDFLGKVTIEEDGYLIAKPNLTKKQKEQLLAIDEMNFMCYGEHWVKNYKDLEEE